MKIFFTWHGAVLPQYRKYMEEIVKNSDVEMTVLMPDVWREAVNVIQVKPQDIHSDFFRVLAGETVRKRGFDGTKFYYKNLKGLISHFRNESYDIIHVYEEPWSLCAFQMFTLKLMFQPRAKFIFQTYENINKNFKLPYNLIELIIFRYSNAALAFSEKIKNVLLEKGFSKDIHLISQGTDPGLFIKKDASDLKRRHNLLNFTIGYVGRMDEAKGIHHLMEAVSRLQDQCSLLLIGGGPFKQQLLHKSNELNIQERTVWLENIANEDLPMYYNIMDVLVLPSVTTARWKEQFGRVLVEAMLCGVPVVGSDSGEIPHVICDAGLIFHEKDVDGLTSALNTMQHNTRFRNDLILRGEKRAREKFTWENMARETVTAYKKILETAA
jgi:L-malate glycosyltransferase